MRHDLERPVSAARPLIGDVERLEGAPQGSDKDRDEDILRTLRDRLRYRNTQVTHAAMNRRKGDVAAEDKYEPQRLSRKICWQYDGNARKVPLLRRPYI
ncbi:MAG TPA: hypothetical protein VJ385_17805 [Fibrobacteria bacterium]|nr:hypothetical protein [Fibrobacteria bacterium]